MGKNRSFTVCNQEKSENFIFSAVNKNKVEVTTEAMSLSSHGGLLLLQQEEERLALASRLASCIHDRRTSFLVRHSLTEIIMTRIFQICLRYEDVNDCDRLRKDPMMKLTVDKAGLDMELCSSATMCRFENMVTDEDLVRIQEMFVTLFIMSYNGNASRHIILDCDDTNVDTYGCQEQTLFNGYYDSYCYMPLMVFEGHSGKMILPLLKPGRSSKAASFEDTILWLIACLREAWPETIITVRGDSHFCSHELMDWASLNDRKVFFITGLARNSVLQANPVTQTVIQRAKHDFDLYRRPVRTYGEFEYKAGWHMGAPAACGGQGGIHREGRTQRQVHRDQYQEYDKAGSIREKLLRTWTRRTVHTTVQGGCARRQALLPHVPGEQAAYLHLCRSIHSHALCPRESITGDETGEGLHPLDP